SSNGLSSLQCAGERKPVAAGLLRRALRSGGNRNRHYSSNFHQVTAAGAVNGILYQSTDFYVVGCDLPDRRYAQLAATGDIAKSGQAFFADFPGSDVERRGPGCSVSKPPGVVGNFITFDSD